VVATASPRNVQVVWAPNPGPQTWLLMCPVEDVFYGGARGGGKTSGALGDFAQHAQINGGAAIGVLVRRTYPELEDVIRQSRDMYLKLGAVWAASPKTWTFPNGATLKLRHLDNEDDAAHLQGHEYTWMCFEEAGNWPTPEPLDKLRACLRSKSVKRFRFLLTGNPGGVGHFWLKARYIDGHPPLKPWTPPETGIQRVFIPAKLEDNPQIQDAESYRNRLRGSGPGWLVAAWLHGDWSGPPSGGFFQPDWMRAYKGSLPVDVVSRLVAVDFAGGREGSDPCAIIGAGMRENRDVYVAPAITLGRLTPKAQAVRILDLADDLNADAILVEHGHLWIGMQEFFVELMHERHENGYLREGDTRRRTGGLYHIEEMPTKVAGLTGKRGRAQGLSAMMEHGKWYFPEGELYETAIKPHFLAFTGEPGVDELDNEIDACAHIALYLNSMLSGETPKKPKDRTAEREKERRDEIRQRKRRQTSEDSEYTLFRGGIDG
jgi:hypothetical protein